MHGKHTGLLQPAFSPRLLVVAFSFLSTALAALLAVTCFFLALDKRSDPNAAISLPNGQKFATFFTAGVFLIILPLPLIAFVSVCLHIRQERPPSSSPPSRSRLYEILTLQNWSLPPNKPFFFLSPNLYRLLLALGILIQLTDGVAFVTVICILKNNDICLYGGRVVLCNLLTKEQKLAVVIPGLFQILSQIGHYVRQFNEKIAGASDFEVYSPTKHTQGSFEMVPGFDPDNTDLEKGDVDLINRGHRQVFAPEDEALTTSFDYSTPYDQPDHRFIPYKKKSQPKRASSTSTIGSQMQGPRPAPKRTGTALPSPVVPSVLPATSPSIKKNKEWFKRFKSKQAVAEVPSDGEEDNHVDGGETEGLVSGSEKKRRLLRKKSDISQEDEQERDAGADADADGEDEGLL